MRGTMLEVLGPFRTHMLEDLQLYHKLETRSKIT